MRIASNALLIVAAAGWLASPAYAMPQAVVDREDPPLKPPPASASASPSQVASLNAGGAYTNTNTNTNANTNDTKPPIPITVQLFNSSPGVKTCRNGARLVDMRLPQDASSLPQFTTGQLGQCYDLPGPAQCGIFMANKADGCEAKLFRAQKCTAFANVAVFQDEARPVGGFFASMAIRCGVQPVEVRPLSLGGLGAAKMQKPQNKDGGAEEGRGVRERLMPR